MRARKKQINGIAEGSTYVEGFVEIYYGRIDKNEN